MKTWLIYFYVKADDRVSDHCKCIVKGSAKMSPEKIVKQWQDEIDESPDGSEYRFDKAIEIEGNLTDLDIESLNRALSSNC